MEGVNGDSTRFGPQTRTIKEAAYIWRENPNSSNMLSLLFCLYFFIMITISIKKLKRVRLLSKIQNEG